MVLPTRTDEQGEHVSFDLLPPGGADDQLSGDRHYFRIDAVGRTLRLNVSESTRSFLSAEHEVEYHHSQHGVRRGNGDVCRHFTGSVREETEEGAVVAEGGWAAISYCTGLVSYHGVWCDNMYSEQPYVYRSKLPYWPRLCQCS